MPIDYRDYPPNWKTEIVPRILARAGEVRTNDGHIVQEAHCEKCGAKNHWPHPITESMVVLTIAHLDHDPENFEVKDERLQALCQRCHLGIDQWRHTMKRRFGRRFFKTCKSLFE